MTTKPILKRSKKAAPSQGTALAAEARAACNTLTRAQREAGVNRAMSLIYGSAAHAAHPGRG